MVVLSRPDELFRWAEKKNLSLRFSLRDCIVSSFYGFSDYKGNMAAVGLV